MYTGISYLVNKNLQKPLWQVFGLISTRLPTPQTPNIELVKGMLVPNMAIAAVIALEHVALAKAFGRINGYSINSSQEMVYMGFINIINSFFGGMPVGGGDMARASVNSASGVESSGWTIYFRYRLPGDVCRKWIPPMDSSADYLGSHRRCYHRSHAANKQHGKILEDFIYRFRCIFHDIQRCHDRGK